MHLSLFDMFKPGIGPSSSHTVGPMRAARRFAEGLRQRGWDDVTAVRAVLYGSLAHTGRGHHTDHAVILGLEGEDPETVDTDSIPARVREAVARGGLRLLGQREVALSPSDGIEFARGEPLPLHPNGMRFIALDASGAELASRVFYSVGGGFVVNAQGEAEGASVRGDGEVPHPFTSGEALLARCDETGLSVSTLVMENERALRPEAEVRARALRVWAIMRDCVRRGIEREGILPGGLKVRRRAAAMHRRLRADAQSDRDPLAAMDWVNLWALAVNEENAAGGRVVTAPTNGAAGIIPSVLHYYARYTPGADDDGVVRFLLAATAIGGLYARNASISGAEVGCQGEVGVACSMAAAGLVEALGGTARQVENAAEIGMEHNLGLTCDPIGGLVQVPCIERNAMGAVKAINAARLAMSGDGSHKVSLDKVIATMRATGADMSVKYKETARGGLAVNIIEC